MYPQNFAQNDEAKITGKKNLNTPTEQLVQHLGDDKLDTAYRICGYKVYVRLPTTYRINGLCCVRLRRLENKKTFLLNHHDFANSPVIIPTLNAIANKF